MRRNQAPERRHVCDLPDDDEGVSLLHDVVRLGAGHGLRIPQHGDHGRAGASPEGAVSERAPDRPADVGHGHPLDLELTERELEIVDDLRPLVRPTEDDGELPRFLVVELEDDGRILVPPALHVHLALAGEMLHHRDARTVHRGEGELHADSGQPRLSQLDGHGDQSTLGRKRRRPSCLDSFISTTPIVAVSST